MNRLLYFPLLALLIFKGNVVNAQSEDPRNKIQMVINFNGKDVTADLNSVSTSVTRYQRDEAPLANNGQDSTLTQSKLPPSPSDYVYLTFEIKKINKDLLQVLSKRSNQFDGTITVTDSYGKNPPKTLEFKSATLYSYSDQLSAFTYNDNYGNAMVSVSCKTLAVDGIKFDQ
ncbi:hypothetical protein RYH73_16055 [Olivibacter sp. CPCC 100613]|uniref:hypothetical protein n=1 Tax=Olivibacter sp. CPCC 100613 TaxID=3079931 RepID=UPI002FF60DD3